MCTLIHAFTTPTGGREQEKVGKKKGIYREKTHRQKERKVKRAKAQKNN